MGTRSGETSDEKTLFNKVMEGAWNDIIDDYTRDPNSDLTTTKITTSGDTALHVAIANGLEREATKLIKAIATKSDSGRLERLREALEAENYVGNTPLHVAASLETTTMCKEIIDEVRNLEKGSHNSEVVSLILLKKRNKAKETPLFVAAKMGNNEIYSFLLSVYRHPQDSRDCQSTFNDTTLHRAIAAENFRLAFQIICLFKDLSNGKRCGYTPLHVLAFKPSAFYSSTKLGRWEEIIYQMIHVEEMKEEGSCHEGSSSNSVNQYSWVKCCCDFMRHCVPLTSHDHGGSPDPESTNADSTPPQKTGNQPVAMPYKHVLLNRATRALSWLGWGRVDELRKQKEKHTWSVQVMKKLIDHNSDMYRKDPNRTTFGLFDEEGEEEILQLYNQEIKGFTTSVETIVKNWLTDFLRKNIIMDFLKIIGEKIKQDNSRLSIHENSWSISLDSVANAVQKSLLDIGESLVKELSTIMDTQVKEKVHITGKELLRPVQKIWQKVSATTENTLLSFEETIAKQIFGEVKSPDSPILIAARSGIEEMVEAILMKYPVAVHDKTERDKSIVLLAVECRQLKLYNWLLDHKTDDNDDHCSAKKAVVRVPTNAFRKVDSNGNSAWHLAAMKGPNYHPWPIPGAALQMQWEFKWLKYIEKSMPPDFFVRYNRQGKTPQQLFSETHTPLVEEGGQWMKSTGESCSVVAALIAAVAFATSTAIPGGVDDDGKPNLGDQVGFKLFAVTSLIALCTSVTSLAMFLAILTSRYQERDFKENLPWKLLMGLASLFVSIASILVSFCAGHFFVVQDTLRYAAFPVYAVMCFPILFFASAQFPLYFDLIKATFRSPFAKSRGTKHFQLKKK
ncbi:uncharacterized protein LOC133781634 isoform X2 [Humulus lupulus]|uniref:uncharacterized protein LOC133781634 isoform X2 n=1 Tax=Humulus lupulus TaxID=3486 RepID=UPI002B415A0B|nr:uncharacterized protein LOC133781634 isoform X2 [Humulus lupulus]